MNQDVTYNGVTYKKLYDNETGSKRSSNARGVNTTDVLTISHQDAADAKPMNTPYRRHLIRLDCNEVTAEGVPFRNFVYVVKGVSSLATTEQITALDAHVRAIVACTTAGSDVMAGVNNNES